MRSSELILGLKKWHKGKGRVKVAAGPGPATHLQKGGRMIVLQIKKMTPFTDIH